MIPTVTTSTSQKGYSVNINVNSGQAIHPYEEIFQSRISAQEWTESLERFNPIMQTQMRVRLKAVGNFTVMNYDLIF